MITGELAAHPRLCCVVNVITFRNFARFEGIFNYLCAMLALNAPRDAILVPMIFKR